MCDNIFMFIIVICHGNICRSPVGAFLLNAAIKEKGLKDIEVISRATSREEIGNDIYPPMKRVLNYHNIRYDRHYATQITKEEFDKADIIYYMDSNNLYYLERLFGRSNKYHLITEYLNNEDIEDPWYTDRYEYVYQMIRKSVDTIIDNLGERVWQKKKEKLEKKLNKEKN